VVDQYIDTAHSVEAEPVPKFRDARILKRAMRESILTSPGSFLKTVADVDAMSSDLWEKEINTSTWVVIEQFDNVVGIAVSRWPDKDMDCRINPLKARFIESVWIAPNFRGSHMGERLVNYLMEVERAKYPTVRRFMLWVFNKNDNAIQLYKRMGFKRVGGEHALGDGRVEVRYEYVLPNPSSKRAARKSRANSAARAGDLRKYGVTYRELVRPSGSLG
jgi:ribosomal protein S18 acetylase RimI-like enzyme